MEQSSRMGTFQNPKRFQGFCCEQGLRGLKRLICHKKLPPWTFHLRIKCSKEQQDGNLSKTDPTMNYWHGEEESSAFCQSPWVATTSRQRSFLLWYTQLSAAEYGGGDLVQIRICSS
jgi:hypothetical protein